MNIILSQNIWKKFFNFDILNLVTVTLQTIYLKGHFSLFFSLWELKINEKNYKIHFYNIVISEIEQGVRAGLGVKGKNKNDRGYIGVENSESFVSIEWTTSTLSGDAGNRENVAW